MLDVAVVVAVVVVITKEEEEIPQEEVTVVAAVVVVIKEEEIPQEEATKGEEEISKEEVTVVTMVVAAAVAVGSVEGELLMRKQYFSSKSVKFTQSPKLIILSEMAPILQMPQSPKLKMPLQRACQVLELLVA